MTEVMMGGLQVRIDNWLLLSGEPHTGHKILEVEADTFGYTSQHEGFSFLRDHFPDPFVVSALEDVEVAAVGVAA